MLGPKKMSLQIFFFTSLSLVLLCENSLSQVVNLNCSDTDEVYRVRFDQKQNTVQISWSAGSGFSAGRLVHKVAAVRKNSSGLLVTGVTDKRKKYELQIGGNSYMRFEGNQGWGYKNSCK